MVGDGLDSGSTRTARSTPVTLLPPIPAPGGPGSCRDRVGLLTAYGVLHGGSVEAVEKLLLAWAEQVWSAWPAHDQETVRQLTIELVPPRYLKR
jgi:hypothetical protein